MLVSILLMSFGFVFMVLFIIGKVVNYSLKVTIVKGLASSMFVALAIYLFYMKGCPRLGAFLIAGSTLGFVGDILLGLKRTFTNKTSLFNYGGLLSFLIGHVVFIVGLYVTYYNKGHVAAAIVPFVVAILFSVSVVKFQKYLNLNFGNKVLPTFIYIILVASFSFSSFALLISNSFHGVPLIMITVGAFFFLNSDLLLCKTYFGKSNIFEGVLYSILYYIAQFLIAFSLFFL